MEAVRSTKYSREILASLSRLGHATNAQLIANLRQIFPEVSATTIHRATARLLERGRIAEAPADPHGSIRYDANLKPHDHFVCSGCGGVRDIDIAGEILPRLGKALGGCKVNGRLVIFGTCETCLKGGIA